MPHRIHGISLNYRHTQLKSGSRSPLASIIGFPVLRGFPRIRFLMHDMTGGPEKLQLLYPQCAQLFRCPLCYLFKRNSSASEAVIPLAGMSRTTPFFLTLFSQCTIPEWFPSSTHGFGNALFGVLLHFGMHSLRRRFRPRISIGLSFCFVSFRERRAVLVFPILLSWTEIVVCLRSTGRLLYDGLGARPVRRSEDDTLKQRRTRGAR
jgi:hypothetical protein